MDGENIKAEWETAGQGHVFRFWEELNDDQRNILVTQAKSIDISLVSQIYKKLAKPQDNSNISPKSPHVQPLPDVRILDSITPEDYTRWNASGLDMIANGSVAVLLLAGGQGTRLGCDDPKGMYDVGLPSHKSLFQIQAERIFKLRELASVHSKRELNSISLPWYIMTSFVTDVATKTFFERHHHFGLPPKDIFFFNQDLFPCVDEYGKILLNSKWEISIAPNGNGGLWSALHSSGAVQDMEERKISLVASYGVDNILAKVADPIFLGFCNERKAPISCKVVSKASPEEKVGVLCLKDGRPAVIEYSEIDPKQASAKDPNTGVLLYNAAHIILNNFTFDFIRATVNPANHKLESLPYHIANKTISCIDDSGNPTSVMGWKFEMFVFDVFEFADSLAAIEVVRSEEFSPLKNSTSSLHDNPITCRQHLSALHQKQIKKAGGRIQPPGNLDLNSEAPLCEISPLVSYSGENLEPLVKGKLFELPFHLQQ